MKKGTAMTTRVVIDPGACHFTCSATAQLVNKNELEVDVATGCESIKGMFEELGHKFDSFEVCLQKPGCGPFFDYAKKHFPVHVSCPTICGIIKAMEVETMQSLPENASIKFL